MTKTTFKHRSLLKYRIILPLLFLIFFAAGIRSVAQSGLLAPVPPMGWMTWNQFGPDINEDLIKEMADAMVTSGMAAAGYEYIIIDDLWQGKRDKNGILQPDMSKFPNGMKALADYVHSKGLKLGIYSDAADRTCGGAVASYGYEKTDARVFAEWGIDYLKYDYCNAPAEKDSAMVRYKRMADAIRETGREMIFAICEWGQREPWKWGADVGGQLWRTTWDIRDTWQSNKYNSGHAGIYNVLQRQAGLEKFSGPGKWNDPDMLVVGLNGKGKSSSHGGAKGCTLEEYQSQMSMWCLINAPLIASNDIRTMSEEIKTILTNDEAIALNQDKLGKQATRIYQNSGFEYWVKPLSDGSLALGILNRDNKKTETSFQLKDIGLREKQMVRDLWMHQGMGFFTKAISLKVPGHGVRLLKFTPVK
jgi:alpha-galactosidase